MGLLSLATGITGSTLINNTANAGNFTTVGNVSTGTLTASGAATAAVEDAGAFRAPTNARASHLQSDTKNGLFKLDRFERFFAPKTEPDGAVTSVVTSSAG